MKKLILTIFVSLALLLSSMTVNAQTSLNVQGGYSWISGVVGGELHAGHFGLCGGWMPTKMPMTGEKVSSVGFGITAYSGDYDESTMYLTYGIASDGFRYENSNGYGATESMNILMVGFKSGTDILNCKLGVGYGWCPYGKAWTVEATLGIVLFGN